MLILGDMRELGAESAAEHRKIVDFLQECSFEKVLLVGEQFTATHPPLSHLCQCTGSDKGTANGKA